MATALDLIKSWTRGSADYRTSRCHCCCNAVDSSRTSRRRRGCQKCRSDWSPPRRYLCTDRGHRILSRCKAAGSLGRLIPQSFCKPQRDLTVKLSCFLTIFMTSEDHKHGHLILSSCVKIVFVCKKK